MMKRTFIYVLSGPPKKDLALVQRAYAANELESTVRKVKGQSTDRKILNVNGNLVVFSRFHYRTDSGSILPRILDTWDLPWVHTIDSSLASGTINGNLTSYGIASVLHYLRYSFTTDLLK